MRNIIQKHIFRIRHFIVGVNTAIKKGIKQLNTMLSNLAFILDEAYKLFHKGTLAFKDMVIAHN